MTVERTWSDDLLGSRLAELACELRSDPDEAAVTRRVVAAAVREVPGTDFAGVTVVTSGGAATSACTDPLVAQLDSRQDAAGQGPCLDAARAVEPIRADDLATDERWPDFARHAAGLGVWSVLACPLFVERGCIGALTLYGRSAGAFPADADHVGALLAAHAAVAMVTSRERANLRTAVDSRDVIGQAKGILMERHKIDARRAFAMLVAFSQDHNVKLRELAERLTRTGELVPRSGATALRIDAAAVDGDTAVLRLCGAVDAVTADELAATIEAATACDGGVVVDLSAVDALSAAGMRVLVRAAERLSARGTMLRLVSRTAAPLAAVRAAGLDRHPRIDVIVASGR
ncbi:MAG: ANTAR domain-containing protein [Pseudonocardia sp.]|nr:ANTAR domain-containing protein [Pseudonocardia sp.]